MCNIEMLYKAIKCAPILDEEYCIAFIYNTADKIRDSIHMVECVTEEESNMIVNSFRQVAKCVYSFDSEEFFLYNIKKLKKTHKHILVYSMAQNIDGTGRRSLIPLICNYYSIINIGAKFLASVLGGNKRLMHFLLRDKAEVLFPRTIYVDIESDLGKLVDELPDGIYILKPNDESASIGVEKIEVSTNKRNGCIELLKSYQKHYHEFSIQEFLYGDEIEVPLLCFNNEYYCPGVCKIIKSDDCNILDYDTVGLDNYDFEEYCSKINTQIINNSILIAKTLGFNAVARVDFIISNDNPYVIDIGPNPTISKHSSANYMFRKRFNNDETSIYQLIVYGSLIEVGLFKPSFYETK